MKNGKNSWLSALNLAINDGLVARLSTQSPKSLMKKNIVSWDNVAPKTGKILSLTIGNSGVCLSASRTNTSGLSQIYNDCCLIVKTRRDISITSIREWATGHENFCMRPSMEVKRAGQQQKIDALYHCFKIMVEVLESYA